MKFKIEWLDWDYTTHYSTITTNNPKEWFDKDQLPSKVRGKCREIIQRKKL